LQSRIDLGLHSSAKEEGLHVLYQELLVLGIDGAQSVVIDQLILRRQPRLPAGLADLFVDLLAKWAAEGWLLKSGKLLPTPHTVDYVCHIHSFWCRVWEVVNFSNSST
jgi:hypothetical protein